MLCKTKEDVMKIVKERNVSFVQFWFTDVLGILKSFAITPSELEEGLEGEWVLMAPLLRGLPGLRRAI